MTMVSEAYSAVLLGDLVLESYCFRFWCQVLQTSQGIINLKEEKNV